MLYFYLKSLVEFLLLFMIEDLLYFTELALGFFYKGVFNSF
jgi:hypothetical protein